MKNIIWSTGHIQKLEDIVEARNCYIQDSKGIRYIDLESGVWATSLGHCNSRINNIIQKQIHKIIHTGFNYTHQIIEITAQSILEIADFTGGKCEFLCSGSEAIEYGIRIAKILTDKPLVLSFSDSFFGAYGAASKRDNPDNYIFKRLECSCNNHNGGCLGTCKEFNDIPFEQIGIFLFEPGSSSGLVRFPSHELIEKIAKKIHGNGGMIMVNEVTTGIGRTGKWFGFQHYHIQPDIVAMGKGLGNGYPVSAIAISANTAEKLGRTSFLYSQSHQNDPLGAAIAHEVIQIIKEDHLLQRCNKLSNKLVHQLLEIKSKNAVIKEIRCRGFMLGIDFFTGADYVIDEMFKRGFLLLKRPYAEVIRMDPALTIEEETLDLFVENFSQVVQAAD
jgi:acetylornithine/N-succinyldiaminopimelate aminotransferase